MGSLGKHSPKEEKSKIYSAKIVGLVSSERPWKSLICSFFFRLLVTGPVWVFYLYWLERESRTLGCHGNLEQFRSSPLDGGVNQNKTPAPDLKPVTPTFPRFYQKKPPFFFFFRKNNIQGLFRDIHLSRELRWIVKKKTLLDIYMWPYTRSSLSGNS